MSINGNINGAVWRMLYLSDLNVNFWGEFLLLKLTEVVCYVIKLL